MPLVRARILKNLINSRIHMTFAADPVTMVSAFNTLLELETDKLNTHLSQTKRKGLSFHIENVSTEAKLTQAI